MLGKVSSTQGGPPRAKAEEEHTQKQLITQNSLQALEQDTRTLFQNLSVLFVALSEDSDKLAGTLNLFEGGDPPTLYPQPPRILALA